MNGRDQAVADLAAARALKIVRDAMSAAPAASCDPAFRTWVESVCQELATQSFQLTARAMRSSADEDVGVM